jgi:hypothetical protein
MAPILEGNSTIRERWLEAERLTGFTDTIQGVQSGVTGTLGQDQMRLQAANVRSNEIVDEMNYSWNDTQNLIYKYNDKYMPRSTKVEVLGTNEFHLIDQLFKGQKVTGDTGLQLGGNFNFSIANKSVEEDEKEKQGRYQLAGEILVDPVFGQDIGNRYRALEMRAESVNFRNIEEIVKKPQEAYVISPQEVINRIMSGETDIQPSVYINPSEYENRIMLFMRTGNYREARPEIKMELEKFLKLVIGIRIGREIAMQKFQAQQTQMMEAQAMAEMAAKTPMIDLS